MSVAKLLEVARKELGVWEDAGKDEDSAGRIAAYRRAVKSAPPDRVPEPWCADFVSWCFEKIGEPLGDDGQGFRSVPMLQRYLVECGCYYEIDEQFPEPGDIVVFDENKNGTPDHCGIVESVEDDCIRTIEGNYSNSVARVRRTDFEKVLGYGRVL